MYFVYQTDAIRCCISFFILRYVLLCELLFSRMDISVLQLPSLYILLDELPTLHGAKRRMNPSTTQRRFRSAMAMTTSPSKKSY